jgi:pimeloyl-ACP methyl ester carboxylesterase
MNEAIGEHWLLLRGLARESAHWGDFVPLLQAAFPTATITMLDLPGTGCWYQETSPATIREIVEIVRRQALTQGVLEQPITLLALSLGGMVGWEWMQRYPRDIAAACLINTSFADLNPAYQRMRWQSLGKIFNIARLSDNVERELTIVQLISNRRDHDQAIAHAWAALDELRPISAANRLRQIIAAARYKPGNMKPQVPVLLLNSSTDRLVAAACSETIQQKWQLPIRRHPWAGHDLPLDDGEWVVTQLQAWVEAKI